jgi:polysaccharide deacetylase 2 family uncharacterized protein YibQ
MADDLSAPLGRKPDKAKPDDGTAPARRLRLGELPLARLGFGLVALLVLGLAARIWLADDPTGGRPVAEIEVGAPGSNAVADSVSIPSPVTITAGPELPAGPGVTIVGDDVPAGAPEGFGPAGAGADGLVPDLLEDTDKGAIPRKSATGDTPFTAYARPALTPATAGGRALVAVVVTGLGLNETSTAAAIDALPEAVTLAFAPYGPTLARSAAAARAGGHEILLQLPLEPFDYPESDPGPDTLLTGQPPRDNLKKLFAVMARLGGYIGLMNHMGARFTASASDFAPVMEELGARGLGYLDDGSSNRSVAPQLAAANAVAFARADMVLDQTPARAAIMDALAALIERAEADGAAIGVISALPVSVETLADWAETLDSDKVVLVPVSALMKAAT